MRIDFDNWSAKSLLKTVLEYLRSKTDETYIDYKHSDGRGAEETLKGRIFLDDERLDALPKKIQYEFGIHRFSLKQKNWDATFEFGMYVNNSPGAIGTKDGAGITCDKHFKKEIFRKFKEFDPEVR